MRMEKGELHRFVTAVATILVSGFIGWQGVTTNNNQQDVRVLQVEVKQLQEEFKQLKAWLFEPMKATR